MPSASASTSTAQISRYEKKRQYLAQQKMLDELEKAELLEQQVKQQNNIRTKERIVEINRRQHSRSQSKTKVMSEVPKYKKDSAVKKYPVQEIEVKLQSVDIESYEEDKFDNDVIQVPKLPTSVTNATGGQGI